MWGEGGFVVLGCGSDMGVVGEYMCDVSVVCGCLDGVRVCEWCVSGVRVV